MELMSPDENLLRLVSYRVFRFSDQDFLDSLMGFKLRGIACLSYAGLMGRRMFLASPRARIKRMCSQVRSICPFWSPWHAEWGKA